LISGEEFGTNLNLTAMCPKNPHLSLQAESWKNGPSILFFESVDANEVSPLFGVPISVPAWGMYTEQAAPVDIDAAVKAVEAAPEGSLVAIPMHGLTPTFVRFKSSLGSNAFAP
jgi:hypothetical protein